MNYLPLIPSVIDHLLDTSKTHVKRHLLQTGAVLKRLEVIVQKIKGSNPEENSQLQWHSLSHLVHVPFCFE